MEPGNDVLAQRRENPVRDALDRSGLYHSFRMPDGEVLRGAMPMEELENRAMALGLPADLTGHRVLDIGPWDGYFAFEMERRGADVTAIDYADLDSFRALHRATASRVQYRRMDIYELDTARDGVFDIVLCLGVLYHLKHPLLGLEKVCAVTLDRCIIDSFVIDGEPWQQGARTPLPYLEFYERDELGGQLDNWYGPTVSAVEGLVRAAGFASAEVLRVTGKTAIVAAHRSWKNLPPIEREPVKLVALNCHSHPGRYFQSQKEEYIVLWCDWPEAKAPPVSAVFPEVNGLGTAPISCTLTAEGLQIQLRVPPGLSPGQHAVRVKIGNAGWSDPQDFFLDLPATGQPLELIAAQDGVLGHAGEVDWAAGGWLTLWADGLSAEADPGNTIAEIDGVPHFPEGVYPSSGQVNVRLRRVILAGRSQVRLFHRGQSSHARTITVKGEAPPIPGLERPGLQYRK
jgi:tRNA (mo5U34)-methyltransferase